VRAAQALDVDVDEGEPFEPPEDVKTNALIKDLSVHEAAKDPGAWWRRQADALEWFQAPRQALNDGNPPFFAQSAIVSHDRVAEAAVIGASDEDTGQSVEGDDEGSDEPTAELREHVAQRIGKLARPKRIIYADDLPNTRSGKIMRRLLKDIAEGRELGDVTTLRDPDVMSQRRAWVGGRPHRYRKDDSAQPLRIGWGPGGRRFKSCLPDHAKSPRDCRPFAFHGR
jgi:hypothetical protein